MRQDNFFLLNSKITRLKNAPNEARIGPYFQRLDHFSLRLLNCSENHVTLHMANTGPYFLLYVRSLSKKWVDNLNINLLYGLTMCYSCPDEMARLPLFSSKVDESLGDYRNYVGMIQIDKCQQNYRHPI